MINLMKSKPVVIIGAGIGGVGSPVIGCGVAGATNFPTVLIALT